MPLSTDGWPMLLPELLLLATAFVVPFLPASGRLRSRVATIMLVWAFAFVAWMLVPNGFFAHVAVPADRVTFGLFEATPFALYFQLVFVLVAVLVSALSADHLAERRESGEYYTLLLVSTVGMMVVAAARDLITLFVALETSVVASFALAGYCRRDAAAGEAAMKFFIVGAVSAALTLYGISLVYTTTGSVNLYDLSAAIKANADARPGVLAGVAFLIAGLAFEITAVPFHMWAPDVYQGSPDPVSAFLSSASKKMGFAAFFKIFFVALLAVKLQWDVLVGILAVLTMTVANVAALQQTSLKRLLAWSSIAQAGYIMIAIPVGTPFGLTGGFFHVLTHSVMAGGAFLLVSILAARGLGDDLESYRGLGKRAPLAAFTLSLLMLSLAGIPPLAGFASKFVLFGGAVAEGVRAGNGFLLFLAVAGIVNSAISVVYYARVVRIAYVDEPAEAPAPMGLPAGVTAFFLFIVALILVMGLYPQPFLEMGRAAADSLLATATP